jgi:hypothetical protein
MGDDAVPFTFAAMRECAYIMSRAMRDEISTWPDWPWSREKLWQRAKGMTFTPDPLGVELIRDPREVPTATSAAAGKWIGDCDERSIFVAACLICLGEPFRFVAMANKPGPLAHVFTAWLTPRGWLYPLDPQEAAAPGHAPKSVRLFVEQPHDDPTYWKRTIGAARDDDPAPADASLWSKARALAAYRRYSQRAQTQSPQSAARDGEANAAARRFDAIG